MEQHSTFCVYVSVFNNIYGEFTQISMKVCHQFIQIMWKHFHTPPFHWIKCDFLWIPSISISEFVQGIKYWKIQDLDISISDRLWWCWCIVKTSTDTACLSLTWIIRFTSHKAVFSVLVCNNNKKISNWQNNINEGKHYPWDNCSQIQHKKDRRDCRRTFKLLCLSDIYSIVHFSGHV